MAKSIMPYLKGTPNNSVIMEKKSDYFLVIGVLV